MSIVRTSSPNRWYAELAGSILLWVEECSPDPPFTWQGNVIRRPEYVNKTVFSYDEDHFKDKSKESAIQNAELTVRRANQFSEYAHRLNELRWQQSSASDEEWGAQLAHFVKTGTLFSTPPGLIINE